MSRAVFVQSAERSFRLKVDLNLLLFSRTCFLATWEFPVPNFNHIWLLPCITENFLPKIIDPVYQSTVIFLELVQFQLILKRLCCMNSSVKIDDDD